MPNPKFRLACWDYDRTRPLMDGRVEVEGADIEYVLMRPREAFTRMLERQEFDIAEMSLSSFARLKAEGDSRFVGIPVALSRIFRHSCIYVRPDAGIEKPEHLRGKRVGVAQLDSTGIVFIKGMLQHDFGVMADEMRWTIGGLEKALAVGGTAPVGHGPVSHSSEPLVAALEAGRLDALLSNHIPSSFLRRAPSIRRLFPDFKVIEKEYYRRTGIFPIMHMVAMRADVHASHPWLAGNLFMAFCKARDIAVGGLYDTDALRLALPWLIDHVEEARSALGDNYWSYGVDANRHVWDVFCQYQFEQSLISKKITAEDLFVVG